MEAGRIISTRLPISIYTAVVDFSSFD